MHYRIFISEWRLKPQYGKWFKSLGCHRDFYQKRSGNTWVIDILHVSPIKIISSQLCWCGIWSKTCSIHTFFSTICTNTISRSFNQFLKILLVFRHLVELPSVATIFNSGILLLTSLILNLEKKLVIWSHSRRLCQSFISHCHSYFV